MARRQRLRKLAERVYPWSPRLALCLADRRALSMLPVKGRRGSKNLPDPKHVRDLLGGKAATLADGEIAHRCAQSMARTRLLKGITEARGLESVRPLVRIEGRERLLKAIAAGGGGIVATWHAGPTPGVWAAMLEFDLRFLKIQAIPWKVYPGKWEVIVERGGEEAVPFMKRCLRHLRGGGWIGGAFDVTEGPWSKLETEFLGRRVPFQRAMPTFAVLAGVPVVPAAARWEGREVVVEFYEPIDPEALREGGADEAERRVLQELVRRMADYLRTYPYESGGATLLKLEKYPPVEAIGGPGER